MKLYSDDELAALLDQDIFRKISEAADHLGVECYVVGGYVRDIFLERPSDDIDVVVVGKHHPLTPSTNGEGEHRKREEVSVGIEVAKELKRMLGRKAHLSVFKNFGTAQVKIREELGARDELGVRREELGVVADADVSANKTNHTSQFSPLSSKFIEVEFVGARRESYSHDSRKPIVEDGTLEDDQNRRDFTINAMAICLNKERFGELVDPFNGLADLEDGIIATPLDPDITFSDDPLRMMRCIRFATQLNFQIEDATFEALERMADRIKIVSAERISVELNKIIMAKHPSRGFVDLQRCGLLNIILPELAALDIVEQRNGRAHKNNFYHTLEVLENICRIENSELRIENLELGIENYDYLQGEKGVSKTNHNSQSSTLNSQFSIPNSQSSTLNSQFSIPNSQSSTLNSQFSTLNPQLRRLYLRWAALLHDVGKTKTKRWDPAIGWTFHNHNYVGAKMVTQIFRRLKLPLGAEMKYVEKLVDLHMRPQVIADNEVTDSAVRRLLNDAGDDIDDLMTLCEADITSKNEVKKRVFLENFRMVREKLTDLVEKDYKRLLQPVIDGNEIMALFDLKPSREVGVLKQTLKDAVLDNRVENEREPLMQLLIEKARQLGLTPHQAS
jgi:putative nucleotidyltransferase with HDIG domain